MGLFGEKIYCSVCGKKVGLNRYKIKKDDAWCCPDCLKKAQNGANGKRTVNCMSITIEELKVLVADPTAKGQEAMFENIKVKEYRNQCNVCGHIYCYTEGDLMRSQNNSLKATMGTVGSVASAVGGSRIDMYAQGAMADRAKNALIDYSRCPNCNSTDIKELSEEEFKALQASKNSTSVPAVSSADELKKYKELLDSGVITQEEFDAKKKQLLGL